MSYIDTIAPSEATGGLKRFYETCESEGGRVWNIVRLMSPNFATLRASMGFYRATCCGPSPLSRALREMIAVVVSRTNDCHY